MKRALFIIEGLVHYGSTEERIFILPLECFRAILYYAVQCRGVRDLISQKNV